MVLLALAVRTAGQATVKDTAEATTVTNLEDCKQQLISNTTDPETGEDVLTYECEPILEGGF